VARSISGSAEIHLLRIKNDAIDHNARCIVVDPISALSKTGTTRISQSVVERLIDWTKSVGITVICTSQLNPVLSLKEKSALQISTIADTWIHVTYVAKSGERNRALSIIKSRGVGHSNQVRELILSNSGITLKDVYLAGGEVLMGALRYEKEEDELRDREAAVTERAECRRRLAGETADLEAQLRGLQRELQRKIAEGDALRSGTAAGIARDEKSRVDLHERRSGDQ